MATEILDVAKIANAKKKVTIWPNHSNVTPSHLKKVVYRLVELMKLRQQSRWCHPLQVDNGKASKQLSLHVDSPGRNETIERRIICATAPMESFIQLTVFTQTLHVWSVFAG